MAEKHYSDDWAKSKSRDLVRDVISRNLIAFRRPKQVRVLFFPGIDAQEVFETYDPLGIPRENLVGIEMDSEVAAKIEEKDLGITVVNRRLEDYILDPTTDCGFDVVSLDYHNPINSAQLETLGKLCDRQSRNHFVLHQANLRKRDHMSKWHYALGYIERRSWEEKGNNYCETLRSLLGKAEDYAAIIRKIKESEEIKNEKSCAYSGLLRTVFSGVQEEVIESLLKITTGDTYEQAFQFLSKMIGEVLGPEVEISRDHPLVSKGWIADPVLLRFVEQMCLDNVCVRLAEIGLIRSRRVLQESNKDFELAGAVIDALRDSVKCRYYVDRDSEHYSYISESGAPMIGDVYFLTHPNRVAEIAETIALKYKRKDPSLLKDAARFVKQMGKIRSPEKTDEIIEKRKNRIFLGSASRPVLTKKRAIEEFKRGVSVDFVKAKYRCTDGKPLAQWKAHVTMGTYNEVNANGEDVEEISKEDALELLVANIPPQEIFNVYPTSFSVGQLRAFKAGITKGLYDI